MMNDHNFSFSSILFSFTDAGNARGSRGKEGAFHCSLALSPLGNIQTFMCKFVSEMATVHGYAALLFTGQLLDEIYHL